MLIMKMIIWLKLCGCGGLDFMGWVGLMGRCGFYSYNISILNGVIWYILYTILWVGVG